MLENFSLNGGGGPIARYFLDMDMDTAEMRLLTVPQFATRVRRSEDEVLALIQSRDVKALRPDPEGGYRVLETEVDRLLQERTTRIKPKAAPSSSGVSRTVPLATHLGVVTTLEIAKKDNARLERLNSTLQAELFQYLRLADEAGREMLEIRSRLEASQAASAQLEAEKQSAELAVRAAEIRAKELADRPWWQRIFR